MKYYFIQHYEVWSGEKSKVDGSYTLPLRHIVIATWLKDIMRKQFGREIHALIPNGVDFKAFYNPEKKWNQTPRLLLMYHSLPWKGFQDGIAVYHKVLQSIPNIKLTIFGMEPCGEIPKDAEYIQNPSPEKLRELYCHADIYLAPSWTEGWHLPPMEAMACKAAVVATNVGCIPDIGVHGQTAMVYEPHDIEGMAEGVVELLKNQAMLEQISVAGYELMQSYTWEKATQRLMLALQSDNRHA
jgi:glycosyltransferase involved in cell wall biosynthesis